MLHTDTPSPRRVLIVDESEDTREVLRTVLQLRGVQTLEADGGPLGLQLARENRPDVIVLDVDAAGGSDSLWEAYAQQANQDRTSLVLLGTARRWRGRAPREFVAKPYQYGPLIRRIEQLLVEAAPSPARQRDAAA